MRTKLWCGGAALASIAAGVGAANAADLAAKAYNAPPAYLSDWAGFDIGVHGGYGWSDATTLGDIFGLPDTQNVKPKGGLAGGHAGYNWQYGSVVAGVEVDFDGAHMKWTDQQG